MKLIKIIFRIIVTLVILKNFADFLWGSGNVFSGCVDLLSTILSDIISHLFNQTTIKCAPKPYSREQGVYDIYRPNPTIFDWHKNEEVNKHFTEKQLSALLIGGFFFMSYVWWVGIGSHTVEDIIRWYYGDRS